MFSTKYTCLDCGKEIKVNKFFFKSDKLSCTKCGSQKLTKASTEKSGCGCGSNKKGSRFT
ncbi:hypothetical protein [Desulfolucanica intricata]|uniref:hypothetical protein n=1 Tax=Desulfolucanica intricata TaxID=1285191 RepID=UPI0008331DAF|nr:hypothetical protein [Desulfolucanica intricata]